MRRLARASLEVVDFAFGALFQGGFGGVPGFEGFGGGFGGGAVVVRWGRGWGAHVVAVTACFEAEGECVSQCDRCWEETAGK